MYGRKPGNPEKKEIEITPEIQQTIVEAIRNGSFMEVACAKAGISYSTFRKWMRKGEKSSRSKYRDLYLEVQKAKAEFEMELVQNWKEKTENDWRAAFTLLKKRFPERWGDHAKVHDDEEEEIVIYETFWGS